MQDPPSTSMPAPTPASSQPERNPQIPPVDPPSAPPPIANEFPKINFSRADQHKISNWIAFALLAVAVVQFIVYLGLWDQAKRQSDISENAVNVANQSLRFQRESDSLNMIAQKKIADSSAALTREQVDASKQAVDVAIAALKSQRLKDAINERSQAKRDSINMRSFILQNRAYVAIDTIRADAFKTSNKFTIHLAFINFGQTPALDCEILPVDYITSDSMGSSLPVILPINVGKRISILPLAPRQSASCTFNASLDVNMFDSLKTKRRYLVCFGFINYIDIFGQRDTTTFALQYVTENNSFRFLGKYNELK